MKLKQLGIMFALSFFKDGKHLQHFLLLVMRVWIERS